MTSLTVFREGHRPIAGAKGRVNTARMLRVIDRAMIASAEAFTFALAPDQGHPARCRLLLSETSGWDVRLEIDARVVAVVHCGNWHRAERVCAEMRRVWTESHTEPSARR